MINVFLDTTSFRQDPARQKVPFKVIERLCELERLKLHISDVTRREFISQQEGYLDECVRIIDSSLKTLYKKLPYKKLTEKFLQELEVLKTKRSNLGCEFDAWLERVGAEVHCIQPNHGTSVMNKYFVGQLPFTRIKERKDFPDAFIWEAMSEVAKTVDLLHVVTGDGPLRSSCEGLRRVVVYKSLENFVSSKSLESLLHKTENLQMLMGFFEEHIKSIEDTVTQQLSIKLFQSTDTPFPDEYNARIDQAEDYRNLKVSATDIEDYGDGLFVIPFSVEVECLVCYYMFKSDYWGMEDSLSPSVVDELNDRVYEVEGTYEFSVSGTLGWQLDEHYLSDSFGKVTRIDEVAMIFDESEISIEDITSVDYSERYFEKMAAAYGCE